MDIDTCVEEVKESKVMDLEKKGDNPSSQMTDEETGGLDAPISIGEGPIELVCSDGRRFTVERSYLSLSTMCRKALEEDSTAQSLNLPGIRGDIFEHVLEFLTHHKGVATRHIEQPAPSDKMVENVEDKWDAEWVDALWTKGRRLLLDVMEGSNSMDVTLLTELCACKIATRIKGIPAERVRARVHPDMTDEDDEKIASGNATTVTSGGVTNESVKEDSQPREDGEDVGEDDEEDVEDDEGDDDDEEDPDLD
jgi:hypothetical protein